MSELKVNPEALRNGVSNRAKQTRSNLEDAYDILSNITVPSDFSSSGKAKFTRAKDQIEEADTDIEEFKEAINTIADNFDETENKNETIANNIVSSQTAYYETQLYTEQIEAEATAQVVGTVVASATNLVFGLAKGIAIAVEGVVDTAATIGAIIITPFTLSFDLQYGSLTGDYSYSATSQLWKSTMSFVSTDWVGNVYNSLYSDTALGQWLDENAAKGFTSDGVVTGIAVAVGQVAGNAIIVGITAGLGGSSIATKATLEMAVGAVTGAGQGMQSKWQSMEDDIEDGKIFSTAIKGIFFGCAVGAIDASAYFVKGLTENIKWSKVAIDEASSLLEVAADYATGGNNSVSNILGTVILTGVFYGQDVALKKTKLFKIVEEESVDIFGYVINTAKKGGKGAIKKAEKEGVEFADEELGVSEKVDEVAENLSEEDPVNNELNVFAERVSYAKSYDMGDGTNYINDVVGLIESSEYPDECLEEFETLDPEAYEEVSKILTSEGKI